MPDLFLPLIADEEDKSSPLKNRIRKNYRHLRKWANRTKTNCFRIYDRDIKDSIDKLQTMIQPTMTVIVGTILGWVMLSVLGPVYNALGNIQV